MQQPKPFGSPLSPHHSRVSPASAQQSSRTCVWVRRRVFQAITSGKFTSSVCHYVPDTRYVSSRIPSSHYPASSFIRPLGCMPASLMEAPNPLIAVEPPRPAPCSHPGPVYEYGEGVFQPVTTGKYAHVTNYALPESSIASSCFISPRFRVENNIASVIQPSDPAVKPSAIPIEFMTTGRMQQSILEASSPLGTVEHVAVSRVYSASRSCHQSRPVPVPEVRLEIFQPALPGEYIDCRTISFPELPLVSSSHRGSTLADGVGTFLNSNATDIPSSLTGSSDGSITEIHTQTNTLRSQPDQQIASLGIKSKPNPSEQFISIYYQNVRGLRTKIVQLRLLLSGCDYDVLVFTETWLREDIGSAEISSDYTLFRCDRSELTSQYSRGGGVLVAVKNNIVCEPVTLPNCDQLEQVAVCVRLGHRSLYIVTIYLPPNSCSDLYSAHAKAVQHMSIRSSEGDIILSLGDFNLSNLRWHLDGDINGYIPSNVSSEHEQFLIENMFVNGFQQINSFVNMNGRLLDLVFVNLPEHLDVIAPSTPLLPVDNHHEPFILLLDESSDDLAAMDDQDESFNFDFKACDYDLLNNAFAGIDWDFLLQNRTVDETLAVFYEKLYEVFIEHVPRKRRPITSVFSKPWWTTELRHLRNNLRKSRKRFFLTRTDSDKVNLREVETSYKELLFSSYRNYVSGIESCVKQNPASFWDFVRKQKSSTRIPCNVHYDGTHACTNAEAADLFATFFESVFTNVSPVLRHDSFAHITTHNITLPVLQFSSEEIQKSLEDVETNKGPGTDGIPPLLLKKCSSTLTSPIARLFNRSLQDRTFPTAWKTASIVPIHKSGSCNRVDNYRGVSKLCCLSKVLEKLVHKVLYNASSSIISESQHGFMKHRSTTTNLMCYVTKLSREIEQRRQVDAVYIDFAKAFDTVPHILVTDKMRHIGFPDWITEWLLSYLSNRNAYVVVNSARSHSFNIMSGVPQGSVLGPLIFNIFINDLCILLSSFKLSFADDLKVYRIIASSLDCDALQEDINVMLIWCGDNGMRVNSKKCKIISFTRCIGQTHHQYYMDAEALERVNSICDLGVTIDSKLRFNDHVGIISAKAFSVLGFIRRHASDFTDVYALKTLYCSLVRSILEYAAPVWSPYYVTQTLTIERVQKRFIRFALRQLPWNDPENLPPYVDRCQLIKLESLSARRVNMQRLFVFDLIKGSIDCPALLEQIPLNAPPRRFRHSPLLAVPYHRTNYGHNNPFDSCLRAFNDVSDEFDFNLSKNVFSNRIKDKVYV